MRDTTTNGGNPNMAENKFRGKGRGQIKQPLTELREFACMNACHIKQGGIALVIQTSEANVIYVYGTFSFVCYEAK